MNFLKKLNISRKVLYSLTLKKKVPIVVGWNITYRCNLQCQYCGYPSRKVEELNTEDICSLVDQMAHLGTKIIILSGGEPLLRKDLGEIAGYCRSKNIHVVIYTNGLLVKKEIETIKLANEIQLSLDGPRFVNDITRGKGVYDKVLEAIEICKKESIKVSLSTVISKQNISYLSDMLRIAREQDVSITFQPVGKRFSGDSSSYQDYPNEVGPNEEEYQKALKYLTNEKLSGNKHINNSLSGLSHFSRCPSNRKMHCIANLISCSIEPNGNIFTCEMFPDYQKYLISGREDFKRSFESLALPKPCEGYCNGPMLELNLIKNLRLKAMSGMWKRFKNT